MAPKFLYTGIRVTNLEESVKFYTEVMGMKVSGRWKIPESNGKAVHLVSEDGGPTLELNYYGKGSEFAARYSVGEGLDHLAFKVKSVDGFARKAAKAGHEVILRMPPKSPRWAYIKDPDGIWIEVLTSL